MRSGTRNDSGEIVKLSRALFSPPARVRAYKAHTSGSPSDSATPSPAPDRSRGRARHSLSLSLAPVGVDPRRRRARTTNRSPPPRPRRARARRRRRETAEGLTPGARRPAAACPAVGGWRRRGSACESTSLAPPARGRRREEGAVRGRRGARGEGRRRGGGGARLQVGSLGLSVGLPQLLDARRELGERVHARLLEERTPRRQSHRVEREAHRGRRDLRRAVLEEAVLLQRELAQVRRQVRRRAVAAVCARRGGGGA